MIPLSDDEILDGIGRCCTGAFMRCAKSVPGPIIYESDELTGFTTGLNSPMANMILETHATDETVGQVVHSVLVGQQKQGLPLMWWTSPSSRPESLGATLVSLGGLLTVDTPGMAAVFATENTTQTVLPGFEIREVGPDDQELWEDTCLGVFNMSKEFGPLFGPPLTDRSQRKDMPMVKFLGLLDGVAVATSSYSVVDNILGIFCVATAEAARGKGIGAEMTKAAMIAGQELGCDYAILQASPLGFSVYEKLGFKAYGSFQRYLFLPTS
jgi:ribosomal protein S18 acetylase RimI-like enzyme